MLPMMRPRLAGLGSARRMSGVFNPADKGSGITLSNSNLTMLSSGGGVFSVRSLSSYSIGRRYYDARIVNGGACIGIGSSNAALNSAPGVDASGLGYLYNGHINAQGADGGTFASHTNGDNIGIAVDFTTTPKTVKFYKNNVQQGGAFNITFPGAVFIFIGAVNGGGATLNAMPAFAPPAGYDYW